jgi:hypothetical protein
MILLTSTSDLIRAVTATAPALCMRLTFRHDDAGTPEFADQFGDYDERRRLARLGHPA